MIQAPAAHGRRVGAGEVEQVRVVDDAAHRDAEPGEPEEDVERDGRDEADARR